MKFGSRRILFGAIAIAVVCLLEAKLLPGQTPAEEKQLLAEAVFKNVQVLKGIPVSEFMGTMGYFSASLGLNCTFCHVTESLQDWQKFADDVPRKRTARRIILMVNAINRDNFGGRRAVTTTEGKP